MLSAGPIRRALVVLAGLLAGVSAALGQVYVSPDVPVDPDGTFLLPWEIVEYETAYSSLLTVPGDPAIDALHRMDRPDNWLFSVEAASDLGGSVPVFVEPRDVILYDPSSATPYAFFFCGGAAGPIPPESNVDAVFFRRDLAGIDTLDLSFDVPTELPPASGLIHDPADVVRFQRVGPGCGSWFFVARVFDASAAGGGIPIRSNLTGTARLAGGDWLLTLDVPTDLAPSAGPTTYLPGQIIRWNGATFDLFEDLTVAGASGWPTTGAVDALSCQATAGRVPTTISVEKSMLTAGWLSIGWSPSCSVGGEDYGIYEGAVGSFYTHVLRDCSDDGGDFVEELSPSAGDRYYLVVAHNGKGEGSYGTNSTSERPPAAAPAARCFEYQELSPCP